MYKVALGATLRGCVAGDDDKEVDVDLAGVATKLLLSSRLLPHGPCGRSYQGSESGLHAANAD